MKSFSLDDKIYDLVNKYPEIKDVLVSLGFDQITNDKMLNTVARFMTLKKAARSKNVDYDTLVTTFKNAGFKIEEESL